MLSALAALIFVTLGVDHLTESDWLRGIAYLAVAAVTAANGCRISRLARR
jgi:hypothetical protein